MSIGFKAMVLCNGVVGKKPKRYPCSRFFEGPLHDDTDSARYLALRHAKEAGWTEEHGVHYCRVCTKAQGGAQ